MVILSSAHVDSQDRLSQDRLSHAAQDVRLAQEPFRLHPGEVVKTVVTPLKIVLANHALRLRAMLGIEYNSGVKRMAGAAV